MPTPSVSKMVSAVTGVSPGGVARQYGYEAVALGCGVVAVGIVLMAAYEALTPLWGPQPARLAVAGALALAAVGAHLLALRRRRQAEREAARSRAELFGALGVAQALVGPRAARLAPLAAFAAAFLMSRRR